MCVVGGALSFNSGSSISFETLKHCKDGVYC